ncbi:20 kDa chaperonin [Plasmodium gaboni]|uniref:20 kDa chaperonin, chloroplastic n=1 Tax=Plasmodium gaboni TaxID=647221 RepID=A0A151LDW4_9APIC|nr:20 kDa chaperonin [Plasmodium gaboni]KYN97120.1 20 kDa chaperonin [Plasmodium gaboni]SOV17663.1 20 kDa chaperonin [Plasmodium gaboni]SOV24375.1 20 kDa chaperonin [Plasmodium sp. DRC-Itaito]
MKIIFLINIVILFLNNVLTKKHVISNTLNFINVNPKQFNKSTKRLKATEYKIDNKIIRGPLTPLNEYILIQKDEAYDTTDSGVFIGDTLKKNQYIGKVLSVGTGAINTKNGERIPIDIQVGDVVIFNPNDGNKIKYNDKECLLISNEEVLGKINDSNEINPLNITPLYDRVLIKLINPNVNSDSLIIIPESKNNDKVTDGQVVAIGNGIYDENNQKVPIDLRIDDYIKFSPFSNESCEFTYQNAKYTFVKARYVMAKY